MQRTLFFQDEISFLRRQLSEALAKKVNTSAYLSTSTVAVNADEPPVKGNLVNLKLEESGIRSDSKKTNTKEKSNTGTNIREIQSREKEKKNESAARTIRTE